MSRFLPLSPFQFMNAVWLWNHNEIRLEMRIRMSKGDRGVCRRDERQLQNVFFRQLILRIYHTHTHRHTQA